MMPFLYLPVMKLARLNTIIKRHGDFHWEWSSCRCSLGKIFFILTGLNLQCCKFCLLPIILPLLTRLLFPSSLQLPVSSRGHQASPQACSFQLNKHPPLALSPCTVCSSPSHPGACLSGSPQVFSASLVLGSPEVAQSCSSGLTRAARRETPASHLLVGYSC